MADSNPQFEKIRNWAHARNIIRGSTPQAQFVKLIEEVGELAEGIAKSRKDAVVDGIGDAAVVLTILAAQHDVSIEQCIEVAWNEIKDRRGKMTNGTFVKEGD
jgi:NTP pyrophosphatase (non-canonical NTP hydrolase)